MAIKVLPDELAENEERLSRFRREAIGFLQTGHGALAGAILQQEGAVQLRPNAVLCSVVSAAGRYNAGDGKRGGAGLDALREHPALRSAKEFAVGGDQVADALVSESNCGWTHDIESAETESVSHSSRSRISTFVRCGYSSGWIGEGKNSRWL